MMFNQSDLMSLSIPVLENVLKKVQKLNFEKFEFIEFNGSEKAEFENFKKFFRILNITVYEPTAQKMFNNIVLCSQLSHLKTGETLLKTIIENNGKFRVYLNNYE